MGLLAPRARRVYEQSVLAVLIPMRWLAEFCNHDIFPLARVDGRIKGGASAQNCKKDTNEKQATCFHDEIGEIKSS